MASHPFGGLNPRPSPWGYNWTTENVSSTDYRTPPPVQPTRETTGAQNSPVPNNASPEPQMLANQYVNMPAALLNTLKREKKPFTYTPGGVNLSEVLNARLQKRMERKKKYSVEHMNEQISNPVESLPKFEPSKQLIVMPTYNSPLDMYSMENALEALEVQAGLVAADKSYPYNATTPGARVDSYGGHMNESFHLSAPSRSATLPRNHTFHFDDKDFDSNRGVAQSKAFKVLQIITDTEEQPPSKVSPKFHQEEKRFSGIRDNKAIQSKFFHTLQRITGTEEDEEQNENQREIERVAAPRPAAYDKQPTTRPAFQPQPKPFNAAPSPPHNQPPVQNHVSQFQPMSHQNVMAAQPTQISSPALQRPAAFLPMKTGGDPLSRVKPVHPTFLANGPRKVFNPSAGTDF